MKRLLNSLSLNLGHGLNHYVLLIFPSAVLTLHLEWGMSYAELLSVGSAAMIVYGVMSLPVGWLADYWSRTGLMKAFFFGTGTAAIATGFAQDAFQISVGLCVIGLFASIYHPVGTALVFGSSEKTGRAIAVNGLYGNLGLALAAVVTAYLSQTFSWRLSFILPGVACILVGIVYSYVCGVKACQHKVNKNDKAQGLTANKIARLIVCIGLIAFVGGLVFQTTTTSLPKVLNTELTSSISFSGALTTFIFVCAAFIQLSIGELIERMSVKKLLVLITGCQLVFLLLATVVQGWWLIPVFMGLMLSTYAQIPVNDWLIGHYSAPAWRSRIYALKYTLSFSTAPIAYWLISSVYSATAGFTVMFLILAIGMFTAMSAAFLIPNLSAHENEPAQKTLSKADC
ncbi:MFS transporter [uncultured Vibrio sp.]|uniref:MFS transporter n=1 Tax=uncultured Vibrio sp. TaxID=114054 RepID=UPI00261AEA04|nr:MFS transporter [uncultured Vibrio sp.]